MKNLKRYIIAALTLTVMLFTVACNGSEESPTPSAPESPAPRSYAGTFAGFSWQGEASGTAFEDATQYIQTILTLDEDGTILDAKLDFFVMKDGYWIARESGNAFVSINYNVEPEAAVPGEDYKRGNSMFTIYTADMMSFYAVGVSDSGVAAVALVDPITRYQLEMRFPEGFDYSQPLGDFPIGSVYNIPTVRTSAGGFLRPQDWSEVEDKTIFNVHGWSHVVNGHGVLEGIGNDSSVKELLEALGVVFEGDAPVAQAPAYGYFSKGGWDGNLAAIEAYLIGKNATELTSLVDWTLPRFAGAINDQNQFGVDVASGATNTVQNSIDGIAGATVRISREATAFQRALVAAGILSEEDVIIGRF